MLPSYAPHRSRGGRGNGLYMVLVVVLSVALVGQFIYWRRQVSDLALEVGGVHARMEKQEKAVREELTEQKNSVQRIMEEKAALEKLNQFLQEKLNDCEGEKTEKAREAEDLRAKQGTLQADLDQLQRECKELNSRTAEAEGQAADLKQELAAMRGSGNAQPENVKPAPKVVDQAVPKAPVTSPVTTAVTSPVTANQGAETVGSGGDAHGTAENEKAEEGTAIQTGGVGEEYANQTSEVLARVAGGDVLGLLDREGQGRDGEGENAEESAGEGGLGDRGEDGKFDAWSNQEGPPTLIRPPDLIGKGASDVQGANGYRMDSGREESAGLLQTSRRSALQAVLLDAEE
ncbi:unnamed protein product [Ostreobium quekettii]|uniref:Uncharacterized protein n=1 Tax=Ostreobium quekettii TaxID=121088 RepID=A0A8S1IQP1_9CHLO|nr:unnamed protein product [Ostreobium quekettii]|eukprot:evm.model.scf_201EXC.4 EVM.evm.TU.scf_201EXC.4   scf_201EXC:28195-29569(-)